MPPKLSIYELYSMKKKKDSRKEKSFDTILDSCHKKIKKIASAGGMNIFFEIPYIVIGLPLYNIDLCRDYIVDCLKKNGLLVQILPPPTTNILYISWDPFDINIKNKKCLDMDDRRKNLM